MPSCGGSVSLYHDLCLRSADPARPFLLGQGTSLCLADIGLEPALSSLVDPGDVVALVGDFDAPSIRCLLNLVDRRAIIMPLTAATRSQHEYCLAAGHVDVVIDGDKVMRRQQRQSSHPLLDRLRSRGHAGLILFSSGSTGRPKAILHDFDRFLARFATPRPAWTTLGFLLFDHIGGLNTLFHMLYNNGLVVRPTARAVSAVIDDIRAYDVQLLPTTPTFLRLLAHSGLLDATALPSLRLITYGTEQMDQHTLAAVAGLLPQVDIRQTYGMSELGILRVRTRKRDELWMQIGGEGVESRVCDSELHIKAENRMLGYLNAPSPFDAEGWFNTRDLVKTDGAWIQIVGRADSVINVGGLKVLPGEVENAALSFPGVSLVKAEGFPNPLTGMHVELLYQADEGVNISLDALRRHLQDLLPPHARPLRIKEGTVLMGHRFKRL